MAHTIEVALKEAVIDPEGRALQKNIQEHGIPAGPVKVSKVYGIDGDLSKEELNKLGNELLADPITENFFIDLPPHQSATNIVYRTLKQGVRDNEGATTSDAMEKAIRKKIPVYTSRKFSIDGELDDKMLNKIAYDILANPNIERCGITKKGDLTQYLKLPVVKIGNVPETEEINLNVSDEELQKISKDRLLALNTEEMSAIKKYSNKIGRPMKDAEIEMLAQTWSEHCKHKIFNSIITYTDEKGTRTIDSLFNTFIQGPTLEWMAKDGSDLVSVFSDNAGVFKLNDDYNLVMKVETHNTPSALDPYGGAITGIVGVNRDPLGTGMGARLFANTDVLCFAAPDYSEELPPRLKHPKRVMEGVRRGIEHGGNKSGIPTVNGGVIYDKYPVGSVKDGDITVSYLGKPLVYCGTAGITPSRINGRPSHKKKARKDDYIVLVGGRTGIDGIHGATFSSLDLNEDSPVSAVQIGDPFTQKKMLDMLLEARDYGYYTSITDNGAGGLSSSVGEMGTESGGAVLWLEKVPLKYEGLMPWQILLSESQERMTLAVPEEHVDDYMELSKRRDVESTVIGQFSDDGVFRAFYNGKPVVELHMEFLHKGYPRKKMTATWKQPVYPEPSFKEPDMECALTELLERWSICSREYIIRQYDHEVQGSTVVKPLDADAAVIWPLEMQDAGILKGVVISNGINPCYGLIDTYHMTASNIDEAMRNYIAVGGNPKTIKYLDNFCWCDPEDPQKAAQLVRSNMAIGNYSRSYGPFISGKDSMYNGYKHGNIKISVPPTTLITGIGTIDNISKSIKAGFIGKGPVYIIGNTYAELGGSEYFAMMGAKEGKAFIGNRVPKVDAEASLKSYIALHDAINKGYVVACHDCSDGGLGVALAEMAVPQNKGLYVDLKKVPTGNIERDDYLLFGESNSRLIAQVKKGKEREFERLINEVPHANIGYVTGTRLNMTGQYGNEIINLPVSELREAWERPMRW